MTVSRILRAAALCLLACLALAPSAHARKAATLAATGAEDPDVAVDAAGPGTSSGAAPPAR